MSMTRKQLREIGLQQEQIEQVIALHAETVEALRRESEEKQAQSAADRQTLEEALGQAKERCAALTRQALEQAVKEALLLHGADPRAIPLLMKAIPLDGVKAAVDEEGPVDLHALIAPVAEAYGDFFQKESCEGLPELDPPRADGVSSRDDLRQMAPEEINRNWAMVREVLM